MGIPTFTDTWNLVDGTLTRNAVMVVVAVAAMVVMRRR